MAYYIIDTQTNKINPNLIKSEVALFETEQDYKNAKQKWITDNTVINEFPAFDKNGKFLDGEEKYKYTLTPELKTLPLEYETIDNIETIKPAPQGYEINKQQSGYIELPSPTKTKYIQITTPNESDYQYRPVDDNEIRQYASDYLEFKKKNEKRTDIVLSFKSNLTIENTHRFTRDNIEHNIEHYLQGQIQEEVFGMPYMYIETTGDLLNEFLAKELIEKENAEIERIKQLKIDAKKQIRSKIKNTTNKDTGETKPKEIIYTLYNNTKPLNAKAKTIPMEGIDLVSSYNQINLILASNNNPVKITSIDKTLLVSAPSNTIIKANQDIANEYVKQDLLIDYYDAHIDYICKTEEDINDTLLFLEDEKNTDVDIIKDGKISIFIPIQDIIIYDNTQSLLVKMREKTLEETNITNMIFKELI